ncbi:hypothetical protein FJZ19_05745 [Candidatus Pacearchaeota archaeon]|nr:hypothetical protein [Candidatus Pacearchaeota archaeon]
MPDKLLIDITEGILGLIGGVGISYLLPYFGVSLGFGLGRGILQTVVSPSLLIFTLIFSTLIGMIFGAIPAFRASKLKPVDALRYE